LSFLVCEVLGSTLQTNSLFCQTALSYLGTISSQNAQMDGSVEGMVYFDI